METTKTFLVKGNLPPSFEIGLRKFYDSCKLDNVPFLLNFSQVVKASFRGEMKNVDLDKVCFIIAETYTNAGFENISVEVND